MGKHPHMQARKILRYYNYLSDPKLGMGIVAIIKTPFCCHACKTVLSPYWDSKIKEAVNQPRYGRVYNCKYSQILGCHNNCILMNCLDDGTDEYYYKNINRTILDGNVMKMSLIFMELNYDEIDTDNYLCRGYYIIKFSSSPYTLQGDLSIDGQVISYGEIVCEGTYFFPININSRCYVLQKTIPLT